MQDCCLLCIDDLPPAKVAEKHKKYKQYIIKQKTLQAGTKPICKVFMLCTARLDDIMACHPAKTISPYSSMISKSSGTMTVPV